MVYQGSKASSETGNDLHVCSSRLRTSWSLGKIGAIAATALLLETSPVHTEESRKSDAAFATIGPSVSTTTGSVKAVKNELSLVSEPCHRKDFDDARRRYVEALKSDAHDMHARQLLDDILKNILSQEDGRPAGLSIEALERFLSDHPKLSSTPPQCDSKHTLTPPKDDKLPWTCRSCKKNGGMHWHCEACQHDYCFACINTHTIYSSYEVKDAITTPETKGLYCSYADTLVGQADNDGKPYVGRATVFVSHAFGTPFCESLDVMRQYAATHPGAYFWFNPLMTNQNLRFKPPFDVIFDEVIKSIGAVVVVLSPWNDPEPMKRSWCLWEIHGALQGIAREQLDMYLPLSQAESLRAGILEDADVFHRALGSIRSENAKAYDPDDKAFVDGKIKESFGFSFLDTEVKDVLRDWYARTLKIISDQALNISDKSVRLLNKLSHAFIALGRYDNAFEAAQHALHTAHSLYGENDPVTATSFNNIGLVYFKKGDYDQAIANYQRALRIRLTSVGENDKATAISYNNIGLAQQRKGEYDNAIENYERAMRIQLTTIGENNPATATSYDNIGSAYQRKGDYDKAIANYERALRIRQTTIGEDDPTTAASYNNIGLAYRSKGDHDKAILHYEKAVWIQLATIGENNPATAISYNNIGAAYERKGDHDKAILHYEKAVRIELATIGENNPATAISYNNIGAAYERKGDYDKAISNFHLALLIQLATIGENNPATAISYNNIGAAYERKGDFDKAIENHERALRIRLATIGENNPATAISYSNIGAACKGKGDFDNAIENYERALRIRLATIGENNPATARTLLHLGLVYRDGFGNLEEGKANIGKAVDIFTRTLGPDHPQTVKARKNLS